MLSITTIQTNLHWENKTENLRMLEKKILSIDVPTEVIVLPEMFSTGFSMRPESLAEKIDGPSVNWMRKISSEKRAIITGSLIIEEEGKYFNRLIWMRPDGEFGQYNKRHLFAYAGEHEHYASGKNRFLASVNGWKILLIVCYDLRFPVWTRQQIKENKEMEYDVMICVANWPERRIQAWKILLQARAIENQSYVIGVNRSGNDGNDIYYSGDSMIIDPSGEVIHTKTGEEEVYTCILDKKTLSSTRMKLPFLQDADDFKILL